MNNGNGPLLAALSLLQSAGESAAQAALIVPDKHTMELVNIAERIASIYIDVKKDAKAAQKLPF